MVCTNVVIISRPGSGTFTTLVNGLIVSVYPCISLVHVSVLDPVFLGRTPKRSLPGLKKNGCDEKHISVTERILHL